MDVTRVLDWVRLSCRGCLCTSVLRGIIHQQRPRARHRAYDGPRLNHVAAGVGLGRAEQGVVLVLLDERPPARPVEDAFEHVSGVVCESRPSVIRSFVIRSSRWQSIRR